MKSSLNASGVLIQGWAVLVQHEVKHEFYIYSEALLFNEGVFLTHQMLLFGFGS